MQSPAWWEDVGSPEKSLTACWDVFEAMRDAFVAAVIDYEAGESTLTTEISDKPKFAFLHIQEENLLAEIDEGDAS